MLARFDLLLTISCGQIGSSGDGNGGVGGMFRMRDDKNYQVTTLFLLWLLLFIYKPDSFSRVGQN